MKSIYITGGNGLLATNLIQYLNLYKIKSSLRKYENLIPKVNYDLVDSKNYSLVKRKILEFKPHVIIHTAGMTDIEKSERFPKLAYNSNVKYSRELARISSLIGCKFIYISTDHLFNDENGYHTETSLTTPLNVYAKTKLLSETAILKENKKSIILRTNFFDWGPLNKLSFLDNIYNNLSIGKKVFLFDDVYFNPVSVKILSEVIKKLFNSKKSGIFNVTSNKAISKFLFGQKIAHIFNLDKSLIVPISIKDKKLVIRPKNLSLSNKKVANLLNYNFSSIDKMLIQVKHNRYLNKNIKVIPYGRHHLDQSDILNVTRTLKSGELTQGSQIFKFENIVKKYVGAKYAVAVSSCTAGLHLCSIVSGLNKKNSFVTSPISFVSTSNAGLYQNSKPLFVDIDPKTINIDIKKLCELIKKDKSIKAIMPVHFAGYPVDLKKIYNYLKDNKKIIIEDAAHALGAKYKDGNMVGSCKYSDMCVFSFHPVKIAAAGEGGMITTNNEKYYRELLRLRSHGINKKDDKFLNKDYAFESQSQKNVWYYEMQQLGFHYRLTDIQSSLAISQMSKIKKFLNKRLLLVKNYNKYLKKFKNCEPVQKINFKISSNHIYIVKINFKKIGISRNQLMTKLKILRIGTQVHYLPIFLQHYYKKFNINIKNYVNSIDYYNNCLTLPLYYDLSLNEQKYIIQQLYKIIE
mgnify:CR=1 FL=1